MRSMQLAVKAGSIAMLLLIATTVGAATLTVTSAADSGGPCPGATCSLRQAIITANAGDTIDFAPAIVTIDLTNGELSIAKALTIAGPGAGLLTVRRSTAAGTPLFRIFNLLQQNPDVFDVTISGLTIANGNSPGADGGAILANIFGNVTITGCTISGNTAGGNSGGAIATQPGTGTVNVRNSIVSGNSAASGGGILSKQRVNISTSAIAGNTATNSGGGIENLYNTTIVDSTISGNTVTGSGGGIHNTFTLTITNSTISGNSADSNGGGIYIDMGEVFSARNTIIAKNTASFGPDFRGQLNSQGFNLIGNTTATSITGVTTGNQLNVDPLLGPLQDNGGATLTHALLSGSTAIENGHSSGSSTDQRGLPRPVDDPTITNATGGDGSDIGAYEVQGNLLPGCGNNVVSTNADGGAGSLRGILAGACAGATITFAPGVVSPITLTSAELVIDKPLTIKGTGANLLTIQRSAAEGTAAFRVLRIASGTVDISGLTIANGNAADSDGGGIFVAAGSTLTLTSCTIAGNTAGGNSGHGGGIANSGTLNIANCSISGNTASSDNGSYGGGIFNNAGALTIASSTFSGNTLSDLGGAIFLNAGSLSLTSTTISGNSAFQDGGISNVNSLPVTVRNSIIAKNTAFASPDFHGPLTSQGFNFIGDNSFAAITPAQFTDQIGTSAAPKDPLLGPLQDNGGPTLTRAPGAASTAIDKGHSSGLIRDQRGFYRPVGIAGVSGGDGGDIGALESASVPLDLDVDLNHVYDPLTDGLLVVRYLLGQTGGALTDNAIGTGATRTGGSAIVQFLDVVKPALDIDGNGQSDGATDGVLLIRYLFGLRGSSLVAGAIGSQATRTTPAQIEKYLRTLIP